MLLLHPAGLGLKQDLLRAALDECLVTIAMHCFSLNLHFFTRSHSFALMFTLSLLFMPQAWASSKTC